MDRVNTDFILALIRKRRPNTPIEDFFALMAAEKSIGLGTYIQEWSVPLMYSLVGMCPFIGSEYTMIDLERARKYGIMSTLEYHSTDDKLSEDMRQLVKRRLYVARDGENGGLKKAFPIFLNPFHRPGQRCVEVARLPNLVNGFLFRVHDIF